LPPTITFKCPSCGGFLTFDPEGQRFKCAHCSSDFDEATLVELSEKLEQQARQDEPAQEPHLRTYNCQMCGAQIVTGETTAATRCYYCHQPVVLADRMDDEFRPDGVIPFQLDKDEAEASFRSHVKKKWFVDKAFYQTARREDFSGVYYPYWCGDFAGEATFDGTGQRVTTTSTPREIITTTSYYHVHRKGNVSVRSLMRNALKSANRKLSDGVAPYRLDEIKPFAAGYLSGFLAERRDIPKEAVDFDLLGEARSHVHDMMSDSTGFSSLTGRTEFVPEEAKISQYLLPAWVMTYQPGKQQKDQTPYYYMINGQTGNVCGRFPVNKGKLLLWSLVLGAAVAALLMLGGALLW